MVWCPLQAKDELHETDELKVSAAKELREMIKEKAESGDDIAKGVQDTFGEKPDSLLTRFIRARKYDVPRAFELMKGESGVSFSPHFTCDCLPKQNTKAKLVTITHFMLAKG